MKRLSLLFILPFTMLIAPWQTNFDQAQKLARENHKNILLTFSGSDWCGPCIRLHKEVFSTAAFQSLADENLVLYNADFPRMKKNQLSKEIEQRNNKLADQYNPAGVFPLTLLLSPQGIVLKSWEGYPKSGADGFVEELKQAIHATN